MEESSPWHEEERTATFYVYHPCHFLQEALRTLLRCLGIESGTSMSSEAKQERSSLPQTHAAADPTISSPTNTHTTSLGAAGPPSVTDRTIVCLSLSKYMCLCFYHQNKNQFHVHSTQYFYIDHI